jgi:hypothetical protein
MIIQAIARFRYSLNICLVLVLGGFFYAGIAQPAQSETLTFRMQSLYQYKVGVKFWSKTRNWVWPSRTRHYVLDDNKVKRMKLTCRYNEKICYGAWSTGRPTFGWGVGNEGKRGCSNCCYRCTGGVTPIRVLRR